MLEIKDIVEFRSNVLHKEEIREAAEDFNTSVFCYMISAEGTFNTAWTRECRGIVFNADGKVSGRPLHKFFNVNERESTRVENLDWTKVVAVMDKRDGSMIHTVITSEGVKLKSKKSFSSDVAVAAQKWMQNQPSQAVKNLTDLMVKLDLTAIFEWTSPDARIVLQYTEPKLTLLHIRDNKTGRYVDRHVLEGMAKQHSVDIVELVDLSTVFPKEDSSWYGEFNLATTPIQEWRERIEWLVKNVEGVEGWIFQFEDGEMVKLKTDWYMKRHRAMTFIRERDIAQLVLDEGLDDVKAMLISDGVNIDEILAIEKRVVDQINEISHGIERIYENNRHMERKEFALHFKGFKDFGLLMTRYTGKQPDYKKYFERNILKEEFSLRQIVMVDSIAEAE